MNVKCLTKKIKKNDRAYIRSLLVFNNINNRDIAKGLKVSDAMVSQVISGKRDSKRIQTAIAKALGMEYEELWSQTNNSNHRRKTDYRLSN